MENLILYYRIIYGEESPFCDSPDHYRKHINYLKKRYPGTKHFKVKLRKTKSNLYEVHNLREFCFSDLENMIYNEGENIQEKQELSSITKVISRTMGIKPENITRSTYCVEGTEVHFEFNINTNLHELSAQEAKFYYYKTLLHDTVQRISKKLPDKVFALKSEKEIKLYIKNYQALANGLINTILRDYIPKQEWNALYKTSGAYTIIDIFKSIFQSLDEILMLLEKSFYRYLDVEQAIPYRSRLVFSYAEKLNQVFNHLKQANFHNELHEIVLGPLEQLRQLSPFTFSYRRQHYLHAYLEAFFHAIQQEKPLTGTRVQLILWQINFNTLKFFKCLIRQINQEISIRNTMEEKLERLYFYQKLCNQLLVKSELRFNPQLPPLKDQLAKWLQEEISYLKSKSNGLSKGFHQEKTLIRMSVAQLALMARALFETGLIGGSRKELLRFFSYHYRTNQQENISLDSLTGKYYKVETSTRRSVGRMMKKMLAHIENAGKLA